MGLRMCGPCFMCRPALFRRLYVECFIYFYYLCFVLCAWRSTKCAYCRSINNLDLNNKQHYEQRIQALSYYLGTTLC